MKTMKKETAEPFVKSVLKSAKKGEKVKVDGFGTFEVVTIPARKIFHNFSGKTKRLASYKRLKFSQSKKLKKDLSM